MDNHHQLMHMHQHYNGYEIALIISMNLINVGVFQVMVGIISFVFMLFRFLKQVKEEGGWKSYLKEWKELLNLFKNAKNDKSSD